ncbi:MAG: polysulfide reductase NrfD [Balneolaceae bacterium]|nr:polysulfide reductase NrfD [Balneolaceae bacterium]MCH8548296.1 polysulfide reductase NrfD [Balneolaceae bacterium]
MSKTYEYVPEPALIKGNHDFKSITAMVTDINLRPTPKMWYVLFGLSNILLLVLLVSIGYLIWEGTGIWGLNQPVGWGWAIINFVWWVGIGHAGTLISAILFLFRQDWRTAINRFAEAMTIFAVMCAGIFPAIHVGRIWVIYWVFPLPNQMAMWPNFNSPLLWDVFAVSTYFTVSLLFWYVGLVPDLATVRDRIKSKIGKVLYGTFALGWRGSNRHWWNYEKSYMILAGLATPLVLSVHTIVSFDFAVSIIPGWHTTIFPPYFVAGAVFSGFAMVLTLMIICRKIYGLEDIMTVDHIEKMNLIILVTGNMVGFAYLMEFFIAWYGGVEYEKAIFILRAMGPYAWAYWIMIACNVISPQFFWSKKLRRSVGFTFFISIVVNIGMWFERFVITVTSLSTDFLPSSWGYYSPTFWDVITYIGTFGLFFSSFLLFLRFLPMVAVAELKGVMPQADPHNYDEAGEYVPPKVEIPEPKKETVK